MSDIYVFSPDDEQNDYSTMGLVGALTPTKCTFKETANGESIVELEHPLDEFGRHTQLLRGNILVVPVPVRTTPEIQNGHCVTTVWTYKVKPGNQLTSKKQRQIWKKASGGSAKKTLNPGDTVTVVERYSDENKRWKVKCGKVDGYIDPKGFELVTEHKLADNSSAIEEIESPWTVKDQLFRIYEVKKSMESVSVSARHISYDLLYNITRWESEASVKLQNALDGVLNNCYNPHEFKAFTNVDNEQPGLFYKHKNPIDAFLDPEEGICAKFEVNLVRNDYELYFLHDPGINRGVRLQYGKNLTGIDFTISDDEVATRIIPVGETKDGKPLYLDDNDPSKCYIDSERIDDYPVIHATVLECEDCKVNEKEEGAGKVTAAIARERMRAQAKKQLETGCDLPKIQMNVEFINLGDTEEYKQFRNLENCFLYDYVIVQHPELDIDVTAHIVSIEWDVLTERMNSVDIGSVGETMANSGITTWQIPSGFSGSKIAGGTVGSGALQDGIISARHLQADSVNTDALQANSVTTEKLAAGSITADKLDVGAINAENIKTGMLEALEAYLGTVNAGSITTDKLAAAFAQLEVLIAGVAKFDKATIKNLVADAMLLNYGVAGQVLIENLAVNFAQMVGAAIGDLVIKASDGKYYHLDVDKYGNVTATERVVSEGETLAGMTDAGEVILGTNITATNLNTKNLLATYALISAIDAARIDVDQLFAREAFLTLLRTKHIVGDQSIEMLAESTKKPIKSVDVEFYLSDSPTMLVGGEWVSEIEGGVPEGKYLWNRTKTVTMDGQTFITGQQYISTYEGVVGPQGSSIERVEEYYALSTSSTQAPSKWQQTIPTMDATNRYLWNYEKFIYTEGEPQSTTPRIIGVFGDKGNTGKGLSEVINWYLISNQKTGVTRQTAGWTTAVQTTTAEKPYLWNYEELHWTEGSPTYTTPAVIGTKGDKGDSITRVDEYYGLSSNSATKPTAWQTSIPTMTSTNRYLWNYENAVYSNGTNVQVPAHIVGVYGDNGRGLLAVTNHYLISASSTGVTTSTAGWTTTVQTVTADKPYLWNYEELFWSDNTRSVTTPAVIGARGSTGPQGPQGSKGKGISSAVEQYAINMSETSAPSSGWSTTQPDWQPGYYIWTRLYITYDDGTSVTTVAVLAEAVNNANQNASDALSAAGDAATKADAVQDAVTHKERDTYMRIISETEANRTGTVPGVYVGLTSSGQAAKTQAVINARGGFEVHDGGIKASSMGVDRITIGNLAFFKTSSGSIAVDYDSSATKIT